MATAKLHCRLARLKATVRSTRMRKVSVLVLCPLAGTLEKWRRPRMIWLAPGALVKVAVTEDRATPVFTIFARYSKSETDRVTRVSLTNA